MSESAPASSAFQLSVDQGIARLTINRPAQANSMDEAFWNDLPVLMGWIDRQADVRVVLLSGAGKHFSAGIDVSVLARFMEKVSGANDGPAGRESTRREILRLQDSISSVERARVPVIAAISGACIGGAVDLIAACDIRLCAADARFCIKEVDFGIVADVGTTQRLHHVIGHAPLMQLSLTAETFDAARAERIGLVSSVHADRDALMAAAGKLAATLAGKPPIALRGVKQSVLYAREHSVAEGLQQAAAWNSAMGFAEETRAAVEAFRSAGKR